MITLATPEVATAIDTLLTAIQDYTGQTASHTAHSFWLDQLCFLGILSLLFTVYSIAAKDLLWPWAYRSMLYDLIRHLYRNRICTLAIWAKYNSLKGEERVYPSDEHYLKMRVPNESFQSSKYNLCSKRLGDINEIELLFRNYNVEIEVALSHIKDDSVDEDTKQRDFETLYFKTGLLSKKLVNLMISRKVFPTKSHIRSKTFKRIEKKHKENTNTDHKGLELNCEEELKKIFNSYDSKEDIFVSIFNKDDQKKFTEYLWADAVIECGNNSSGGEKIHMIKKVQKI